MDVIRNTIYVVHVSFFPIMNARWCVLYGQTIRFYFDYFIGVANVRLQTHCRAKLCDCD